MRPCLIQYAALGGGTPVRVVAVASGELLASLKSGLGQAWGGAVEFSICATDMGALQVIEEQGRPDVLVVDLDSPGVTWLEALKAIRSQEDLKTMPILLVSTKTLEMEHDAAGRTVRLAKPVAAEDWKEAIHRALAIPAFHETPKLRPVKTSAQTGTEADRKSPRKECDIPCTVGTQANKMKGTLTDISMSGARVVVERAFALGTMLTLAFIIPGTFPPKYVHFKGRIVRQTEDGYAIAFWEMDPLTRSYLGALVGR